MVQNTIPEKERMTYIPLSQTGISYNAARSTGNTVSNACYHYTTRSYLIPKPDELQPALR
jgi:hypothetical protein